MLDLAFLALMIYVCVKANKGEYKETACNVALVVGILAGLVGCIIAITKSDAKFLLLNMIVMLMSFGLRFAARHLAKLYNDKQAALTAEYERDIRLHSRFSDKIATGYADDDFDNEDLRFGKGGYTDNKL